MSNKLTVIAFVRVSRVANREREAGSISPEGVCSHRNRLRLLSPSP